MLRRLDRPLELSCVFGSNFSQFFNFLGDQNEDRLSMGLSMGLICPNIAKVRSNKKHIMYFRTLMILFQDLDFEVKMNGTFPQLIDLGN